MEDADAGTSERAGGGWRRRAVIGVGVVLVVGAIGALGYLTLDQRDQIEELSDELDDSRAAVSELEDRIEAQGELLVRISARVLSGTNSLDGLATRIDNLETQLFGFPGFGVRGSDILGELEREVARLDSCIGSIVRAFNSPYGFVDC